MKVGEKSAELAQQYEQLCSVASMVFGGGDSKTPKGKTPEDAGQAVAQLKSLGLYKGPL